jgi:hypothetical protein
MSMHRFLTFLLLVSLTAVAHADDAAVIKNDTAPITMHLESAPTTEVLAELAKLTGVQITVWPENLWEQYKHNHDGPPASISVDADNKSFWQVMQQISEASKLSPFAMGAESVITMQFNQSPGGLFGKRPTSIGPSATITANSLERQHTVNLDSETVEPTRRCGVNLTAYVDPRLRMIKYHSQPTVETATDENGTILTGAAGNSAQMQATQSKWQLPNLFLPLDYDPAVSKKLAVLKGSVHVSVASEIEKLEITDLPAASGMQKDVAGRTITIEEVKDENNSVSVELKITRGDVPKEQFRELTNDIFQAVDLRSADGKRRNNSGGGGGGDDEINYSFSASYSNEAEKAVALVWEIPTKIEEVELPFEFKDLPLP